MTTQPARVAERYELVRELGRGAMAVVYLAHDVKFGVDIALKVAAALRANAYGEFKARFVREARIGYLLGRQAGFVRALDWGELPGGDLYLAADLVPEATPLDLRAGLRPVADRVAVLRRAATLVGRVHAQGIVHRDVKPANFLVSGEGELFLTDFGLAKVLRDREAESDILGYSLRTGRDAYIGTPQFMAPEQFEDPAGVDARADIYALGVMLYHALTGRYPYDARTGVQLICKHLAVRDGEEPPPRPRDVDPRIDAVLDDVCATALAIDPERRPPDVEALLAALARSPEAVVSAERLPAPFVAAMRRAEAARPRDGPPSQAPGASQGATSQAPAPHAAPAESGAGLPPDLVDADGLTTPEALRELRRRLGPDAYRAALAGTCALRVADEREFQGGTRYLGKVGPLRRRPGVAGPADQVSVGRSRAQADLVFELPTISTVQLRLTRRGDAWHVAEAGSRNGTELNGAPLAKDEARPLKDGDVLYLSKHLTLVFHAPASLERALGA